MKRDLLIFENSYNLTNFLLKKWAELVRTSIEERGQFSVALSGGRSPLEFYCRLSGLDNYEFWQKTHFFFTEERFLPLSSQETQFSQIQQNLLTYITIPPENIHRIETGFPTPREAARHYAQQMYQFFRCPYGDIPAFDLILLGVGEDGHVAGLYRDSDAMEANETLVSTTDLPVVATPRITMTLPVINHARNVFVVAVGKHKATVIKEIFQNNLSAPASMVQPVEGKVTFILDKEAARLLDVQENYSHQGEAILINA